MATTTRHWVSIPRSSLAIPAAAAVSGAAFFAWKPSVALSMLGSPRAFGFAASVGILILALGWLLPRLGHGFALTAAAQAVPVVIAFVITVLPAFRTVTVNDPLPGAPVTATMAADVRPDTTGSPGSRPAVITTTLSRSTLTGINHRASGSALLIRIADGSHVIRLEHLAVE